MSEPRDVVVVDDDPDMRLLLTLRLERLGWAVRAAATVADGMARLRERVPDLAILDLRMPGPGGRGLLLRMREDPDLVGVPVLVVSADTSQDVAEDVRQLGARGYLSKPFNRAELEAAVAAATGPG